MQLVYIPVWHQNHVILPQVLLADMTAGLLSRGAVSFCSDECVVQCPLLLPHLRPALPRGLNGRGALNFSPAAMG